MFPAGVIFVAASAVLLTCCSAIVPRCRNPNELWYDVMPTCALTCDTVGQRCPDPAISPQVSGCACKTGFHRNGPRDNDPCVSTERCLRKFLIFRPCIHSYIDVPVNFMFRTTLSEPTP